MRRSSTEKLGFWEFVTKCEKFNNVQILTFWQRLPVRWRELQRKWLTGENHNKLPRTHILCHHTAQVRTLWGKMSNSGLLKREADSL